MPAAPAKATPPPSSSARMFNALLPLLLLAIALGLNWYLQQQKKQ